MTTQTQLRRDTNANLSTATPALGEPGYNQTTKRLHMGDGSTPGGVILPNAADIQQKAFQYAAVGGTANAITLALTPAPAALAVPLTIHFQAAATNTAAVTATLAGDTARNIYKLKSGVLVPLAAGDIVAGVMYTLTWDGALYQITGGGVGSSGGAGSWGLLATASGSAGSFDFNSIPDGYDNFAFAFQGVFPSGGSGIRTLKVAFQPAGAAYGGYVTAFTYVSGGYATSVNKLDGVLFATGLRNASGGNISGVLNDRVLGPILAGAVYSTSDTRTIDGVRFGIPNANINGTIFMYGIKAN